MATERLKNILTELDIDFVKYRYICAFLSTLTVLCAWVAFFVYPGPSWGIDFTGGTEIQIQFTEEVRVDEIREALERLGLSEDSVQQFGNPEDHRFNVKIDDPTFGVAEAKADVEKRLVEHFGPNWLDTIDVNAEVGARLTVAYKGEPVKMNEVQALFKESGVSVRPGVQDNEIVVQLPGLSREIKERIRTVLPDHAFEVLQAESVGPRVGAELRVQAFISILATMGLVLIYIAFRFDLTFAPGAIFALIHDTSVIAGAFVLFDKEFSLSIIGAMLTVIGYSLNDTVVVYDRLRENREKYRRMSTKDLINRSVNETLTRTITTSGATLLAIAPFLVIGGPVVGDFAFAMFLGIVVGAYSTIYVATPLILVMEDIKPHLQRMIAGSTLAPTPAVEAAPGASDQPITESEKRRRERADREREQTGTSTRGGIGGR